MAVNKVVYGTTVLVDLTSDTVDAEHLASGYTAHDKAGNPITGTMEASGEASIGSVTASGSDSTSISFSGLHAQPKMFSIMANTQFDASSTRCVISVMTDGTTTLGTYNYQKNRVSYGILYVSSSYFTWTYSDGTLTVKTSSTTNGGVFKSGVNYVLNYVC